MVVEVAEVLIIAGVGRVPPRTPAPLEHEGVHELHVPVNVVVGRTLGGGVQVAEHHRHHPLAMGR